MRATRTCRAWFGAKFGAYPHNVGHYAPAAPGLVQTMVLTHTMLAITHLPLRLPHVHVNELGALDAHERGRALRGHGLGQQRLAAACARVLHHE